MMVLRVVLALAFLGLQQGTVTSNDETSAQQRASLERERHRQAANQINDLAERIHSEADAVAFVDKIAEFFADTLPPIWAGSLAAFASKLPMPNSRQFPTRRG
jgi:hypothetical protein